MRRMITDDGNGARETAPRLSWTNDTLPLARRRELLDQEVRRVIGRRDPAPEAAREGGPTQCGEDGAS